MKMCTKCSRVLSLDSFANHTRDGKQSWCKACMNKEATRSRQQPVIRAKRTLQEHKRRSMIFFGLTSEEYDALMADRKCQVCGSETRITLDHDHLTGRPRGVLCSKCNLALGHLGDDPERIRSLALYVETHNALASR